ncbi:MAG: septum formation initiator family protein [Alphaproteobacteria bacterium]|nr:septum formation initiator family protein [Alphaproteobacteria bacterium]
MRSLSRFFKDVVLPVFFACWIGYLAYGAVAGAASYRTLNELRQEEATKRAELDALKARHEALARRAKLLNPHSLDPDMVDEEIRTVLGYARPGDFVVPRDELERVLRSERSSGK